MQDEITETIVTTIVPEVDEAERTRAQRKPVASLDAWDLYLRGIWQLYQSFGGDQSEALALFRKVIELGPRSAQAHAGLARALTIAIIMGKTDSAAETMKEASAAARRATELDDRDAYANGVLSRVYLAQGNFDGAIAEGEGATELSPNDPTAQYYFAWALMFGGRPGDAVSRFENALRLNPRGAETFGYLSVGAGALVMLGRNEDAVDWAQRSLLHPAGRQNYWTYAQLASAFGHFGRLDEARGALAELLEHRPEFSRDYLRSVVTWANDDHFENYFDGLCKAGLTD